jgi:hypothetical protein
VSSNLSSRDVAKIIAEMVLEYEVQASYARYKAWYDSSNHKPASKPRVASKNYAEIIS